MEQVKPLFSDEEELQLWLEHQLESVLINYSAQHGTKQPCSYSDEEMYVIIKDRLQSIENGTSELVDGDEVFSKIRARYGIKATMA